MLPTRNKAIALTLSNVRFTDFLLYKSLFTRDLWSAAKTAIRRRLAPETQLRKRSQSLAHQISAQAQHTLKTPLVQ